MMKKDMSLKDFSRTTAEMQKEVIFIGDHCFQQSSTGTRLVICDLDDVLFYTNFIFGEIESIGLTGEEKWNYFHENVVRCPVIYNIYLLLKSIKKYAEIVFLTARSEVIQGCTMQKLHRVLDFSPAVVFRKENDYRESWEVKEDFIKSSIGKSQILFALDDDIKNCEMYARHGIPVLHVLNAEGRVCSVDTEVDNKLAMSCVKSD